MFDMKAFRSMSFQPREVEMKFSTISEAGLDGSFKVRGLTSLEIAQAEEASQKGKLLSDIVEKLAGSDGKERASAILEGVGISDNVPALLAKRYEHVCRGSVDPKMSLDDVVRFGEVFPIELAQIANKIAELTGLGQVADVKPRGSINEPT